MSESKYRPYLASLLYKVLYRYFMDVTSVDFARKLKDAYTPEEYAKLIASLEWVLAQPAYPFGSLLPEGDLSVEEIRREFTSILGSLKSA